jgi:hypothetical protein
MEAPHLQMTLILMNSYRLRGTDNRGRQHLALVKTRRTKKTKMRVKKRMVSSVDNSV